MYSTTYNSTAYLMQRANLNLLLSSSNNSQVNTACSGGLALFWWLALNSMMLLILILILHNLIFETENDEVFIAFEIVFSITLIAMIIIFNLQSFGII